MSGLPMLKPAPGLFPGIDMPLGSALVTIDKMQGLNDEITALKIGSQVIEGHGFLTTARLLQESGNTLPLCYDRQKGATDVPFMVNRQVEWTAPHGFDSYIGSPLGAGSNSIEDAQGTLEAFVASCKKFNISPIVVLEMTQPGALRFSSQAQAVQLAKLAYDLGVRYFVAPATKPDRIAAYREVIGDSEIISPGVGPQKSGNPIEDAKSAILHGADHIVVGRAIYNAADPVAAAKDLYAAIAEAHAERGAMPRIFPSAEVRPPFVQDEFLSFIDAQGVVGLFENVKTLKSGRKSHWYANWRDPAADAYATLRLASFFLGFLELKGIEFDTIYGVPEGATKLAVAAQLKWARNQEGFGEGSHSLLMGRGKPKDHGDAKDRYFVGEPTGRVVVVEDVTTTGGSLIDKGIIPLQESGAEVVAAVGLTDRQMKRDDGLSVAEAVAKLGVDYFAMSTAEQVLPPAVERSKPSAEVIAFINGEIEEFGTVRFKL